MKTDAKSSSTGNGRVVTRKLEARTRSEAGAEAERLRSQACNEGSLLPVDRRTATQAILDERVRLHDLRTTLA